MTRALTPWGTRLPRLFDFEVGFPRWMRETFGPEEEAFGREFDFLPAANITESDKALEVAGEVDVEGWKRNAPLGEVLRRCRDIAQMRMT